MKKALSILLTLILICGVVSLAIIPASAEEEDVSLIKSEEFLNKLNEYIENDDIIRTYVFGNDKKQKLDAYNIESKIDLYE